MFILFDIGGSKMRIAGAETQSEFETPIILDTPQNFDEGMTALLESMRTIARGREITMAVGGVTGAMSHKKDSISNALHLPEWTGKPVKRHLEEALNAAVYLENDSAMVGLGEAHFGAGKGFTTVAYLTVSTGVGGTRIVRGRLDPFTTGFEPGHQIIDISRGACPTCKSGTLEDYVSGSAVADRLGKHPREITDTGFWQELARYLAVGVMNTILHWTPNVVVLGGSMMVKKPGIAVHHVEVELKKILTMYPTPVIVEAKLQSVGGLYGGLALLEQLRGAKETRAV